MRWLTICIGGQSKTFCLEMLRLFSSSLRENTQRQNKVEVVLCRVLQAAQGNLAEGHRYLGEAAQGSAYLGGFRYWS